MLNPRETAVLDRYASPTHPYRLLTRTVSLCFFHSWDFHNVSSDYQAYLLPPGDLVPTSTSNSPSPIATSASSIFIKRRKLGARTLMRPQSSAFSLTGPFELQRILQRTQSSAAMAKSRSSPLSVCRASLALFIPF